MSVDGSRLNLEEHDQLKTVDDNEGENTGLLSNIRRRLPFEINGLFYIVLGIIILGLALTIGMILSIFFGPSQIQPHSGVSTDVKECSNLALSICKKGGSAVDGAIGAFICMSVVRPDIAGFGGCGSMLVYNHSSSANEVFDMSCAAPPNAYDASIGVGYGLKESVAIPGIFSGLMKSHKVHGRLNWRHLMTEVINQLNTNIQVTDDMKSILHSDGFAKLPTVIQQGYKNSVAGEKFVVSKYMTDFLIKLKSEGLTMGLNGSLVDELNASGFQWRGQMDNSRKQIPLKATFGTYVLFTAPLPSKGGLDLAIPLQIFNLFFAKNKLNKDSAEYYHILLEAIQLSQAMTSFLGDLNTGTEKNYLDPNYIAKVKAIIDEKKAKSKGDYGPFLMKPNVEVQSGTQITVVDSFHTYVSFSVSLGSHLGSGLVSGPSGIILNDAMREFLPTPDSNKSLVSGNNKWIQTDTTNNVPKPLLRPLTQLAPPAIIFNAQRQCGVRFATGGNNGIRGTTGILQMIMSAIYLDQNFCPTKDCMALDVAGKRPRLHTYILSNSTNITEPGLIYAQQGFNKDFMIALANKYGHRNYRESDRLQSVNAVGKVQYEFKGYVDRPTGAFVEF